MSAGGQNNLQPHFTYWRGRILIEPTPRGAPIRVLVADTLPFDALALLSNIITGEIDVLPVQRRKMPQELTVHRHTAAAQILYCALEIDCIL